MPGWSLDEQRGRSKWGGRVAKDQCRPEVPVRNSVLSGLGLYGPTGSLIGGGEFSLGLGLPMGPFAARTDGLSGRAHPGRAEHRPPPPPTVTTLHQNLPQNRPR